MRKPILKLFNGMASVRDYEVEKCIKSNDIMHIIFEDKCMTLSPKSLKEKVLSKSDLIKSQNSNKDYHLINYKWEPNVENDD